MERAAEGVNRGRHCGVNTWPPVVVAAVVKCLRCLPITQVAWDHREGATAAYKAARATYPIGREKVDRLGVNPFRTAL